MRVSDDGTGQRARSIGSAAVLLGLSVAAGCSDFFSAEVTGFLKRERTARDGEQMEPGAGINGAGVRIFFKQPHSFDDLGFVAHTTTIDNRSAGIELPGFYRASVAWETSSPDYGEGDRQEIWIAARHPDYEDRVVQFEAVQSSAINLVPEILLRGLRAGPDRVTGEVQMDGVGVDGVRIVLTIDDGGEAFEARTQTVAGRPGVYALDDVRWDGAGGAEASAMLAVVDPRYLSSGELALELVADQTIEVAEPISVRPTYFSAQRVRGRVIDASGQGVNGVRVVLRPERARDAGALAATVSTMVDGHSGIYQLLDFGWLLPNASELFDTYDTQTVLLDIEDDAYVRTSNAGELAVRIGYQQELDVSEDLVVARRPRSQFAALLQGRCVEFPVSDAGLRGVAGVEVRAEFADDGGMHRLVARTDPEGRYSLLTEWTRERREDDLPSGEDAIEVELTFSEAIRGERRLVFGPLSYVVRSWIRPNYVPDAIASIEDEADAGM